MRQRTWSQLSGITTKAAMAAGSLTCAEGIFWDWPGDTEVVMARKPG